MVMKATERQRLVAMARDHDELVNAVREATGKLRQGEYEMAQVLLDGHHTDLLKVDWKKLHRLTR